MSSVITTQITLVEDSNDEDDPQNVDSNIIDLFESQFSSDSDSDEYLEDTRYERTDESDICDEASQMLTQLLIKNNFHKLEIIQRKKTKNEANKQMVTHVILTDKKVNSLTTEDLNDESSEYFFESKSKLLKESERKLKQKKEREEKSHKKKAIILDILIERTPKTFEEFLKEIFDMKADPIFEPKSKLFFKEETHNRDIRFKSHELYVSSFIPFVIRELWSALKASAKSDLISYQMKYFKSEPTNEIILSYIRDKSCRQSVFKYGQIVVIKYPVIESQETDPNQESEVLLRFGVVIGVNTELIDKTSEHLSDALLLSQTNEENDYILEKLIIYCNPLEQIYESVSITPLICVQKYLLEARIVYELKEQGFQNIFQQILKPIYAFGASGFSVNLEQRQELYDIQKDAIQKAYEVCCLPPSSDFSNFVAVYGGPKTGKTEILCETVVQLLKSADEKIDKLVIIAMGDNHLTEIIETLKRNEIKVFHIDSEGKCLSHKNAEWKRIIRRMDKDNMFDDITGKEYSFKECLKFYSQEIQLTDLLVRDIYVKEMIDKKVTFKLIGESEVIIGSIASVMNNEEFNLLFNMNIENNIKSALIDEAHLLTETEFLTLLYSGVRSFVLFGDVSKDAISYEKCESFLKRYIGLYSRNFQKTDATHYSSVLYLKETIASLQRLANSKNERNTRFNNNQNTRFGRKNPHQVITQYRNNSNYGSEFFNQSDRFKNYKPYKIESKEDIKSNFADNTYSMSEHRNGRGQSRPVPSTSQWSHNAMIDGITHQFAFDGRGSYLPRSQNPYNSHRFSQPHLIRNGMPRANSDPNTSTYPSNGSRFVSNPTRHPNNNLF